ncbi:MAG TPA: T9SS type A sorting domain-containing protein [Flavobacteriales bacterium]|nr:T9SS type A sorting domain-containing protein [Flavobacteriales bacterium]
MSDGERELIIFDLKGSEVSRVNCINEKTITLGRQNLPAGVYLFEIHSAKAKVGMGKLIIR